MSRLIKYCIVHIFTQSFITFLFYFKWILRIELRTSACLKRYFSSRLKEKKERVRSRAFSVALSMVLKPNSRFKNRFTQGRIPSLQSLSNYVWSRNINSVLVTLNIVCSAIPGLKIQNLLFAKALYKLYKPKKGDININSNNPGCHTHTHTWAHSNCIYECFIYTRRQIYIFAFLFVFLSIPINTALSHTCIEVRIIDAYFYLQSSLCHTHMQLCIHMFLQMKMPHTHVTIGANQYTSISAYTREYKMQHRTNIQYVEEWVCNARAFLNGK